jgi:hypothetical protein
MVKALMVACKVSMACTSSQDPGQKGPRELQLSGALGRDDDSKNLGKILELWTASVFVKRLQHLF